MLQKSWERNWNIAKGTSISRWPERLKKENLYYKSSHPYNTFTHLQRWPEKMEDEKGLVAREWLYTKVFGVWYLVFGVGGSIQRYLVLILWIVTTMTIEMVIMANSSIWSRPFSCRWHNIWFQIIDASQKKYCGKLCGLVLAGGMLVDSNQSHGLFTRRIIHVKD